VTEYRQIGRSIFTSPVTGTIKARRSWRWTAGQRRSMAMFFYARVSTVEQELAHQLAQARAAGFDVDADRVVADQPYQPYATHPASPQHLVERQS
jgi:hypothetical protein